MSFRQRAQLRQQPLHFFRRVVVRQADAQHAAALLHAQPLGQVDGVVVAVPGKDAALTQALGQVARSVALQANGNGRRTLVELRRIGDAIEGQTRDRQQSANELRRQFALVLLENLVGGNDGLAPRV